MLIDALSFAGEPKLAEDLALALDNRAAYDTIDTQGRGFSRGAPIPPWHAGHLALVLQDVRSALYRGRGSTKTEKQTLPSTRNDKTTEKKVRSAAAARFGRGRVNPFFEHGHWWVEDLRTGAQYDVIDVADGFAFEQVSSGED